VGDQELVAAITSGSAKRMKLKVGERVFAVIKATEVMIAKE
jgi:molybdopterin-binding protein